MCHLEINVLCGCIGIPSSARYKYNVQHALHTIRDSRHRTATDSWHISRFAGAPRGIICYTWRRVIAQTYITLMFKYACGKSLYSLYSIIPKGKEKWTPIVTRASITCHQVLLDTHHVSVSPKVTKLLTFACY